MTLRGRVSQHSMAFRASRSTDPAKSKPTAASASPKKAESTDIPSESHAAPFSIEDLVGAPQGSPKPSAEQPLKSSDPVQSPDVQPTQSFQPPREQGQGREGGYQPRQGYGGGQGRFGQHGGGYGGGNRGGQRFYSQGGSGGGYNRRPQQAPYRREYSSDMTSNGFTQDINVPTETVRGMLDIMPEGHGFLRPKFTPGEKDVYISQSQIRRFLLRNGDVVEGQARSPKDNERYYGLLKVEKVNEHPAEQMQQRPKFEDLVPIYPNAQIKLETGQLPLSTRIVDLVAPIGFGQRGLVVSPPKAGKTTILKELAAGISANYPDVHLMAALIGERPEEVTDLTRSIKGEVLASNFDESPQEQTRIAEVALDRAKRLVEMGKDVVILLDSITRLARAYNLVVNPSGRTLSGGFDPAALYPAKRFLGAARCVEPFVPAGAPPAAVEQTVAPTGDAQGTIVLPIVPRVTSGGSLTVIGTALVETGSRMDDLIYEEFKGTGNMELHLSRTLQERRVFPAIDLVRSGTRHDELLLGEENMKKVTTLRHMLSLLSDEERTLMMIDRLSKTKSNAEFLESLSKG